MPTWRKLHTKSLDSLDIQEMSNDTCRLFWNNLTLIADKEGRGLLNEAWLRAKAFPLRQDISNNQLMGYMKEFEDLGMIRCYRVNNRDYFEICNWNIYQSTVKEAESNYPPNPELVQSRSGVGLELVQSRSGTDIDIDIDIDVDKDVDVDEEKIDNSSPRQSFITDFVTATRVQFTNPNQPQDIDVLVEDYGESVVLEAATWYGQNNPRNMSHALKSIDTALRKGWNSKGESVSDHNKKLLERITADGN